MQIFELLSSKWGLPAILIAGFYFLERVIGKLTFQVRSKEIMQTLNKKIDKVYDIANMYGHNVKSKLDYIYEMTIENKQVMKQISESLHDASQAMNRAKNLLDEILESRRG